MQGYQRYIVILLQVVARFMDTMFYLLGTLVAICYVMPVLIVLVVILGGILLYIQKVYTNAAQVFGPHK